jgi:hypothetical protein
MPKIPQIALWKTLATGREDPTSASFSPGGQSRLAPGWLSGRDAICLTIAGTLIKLCATTDRIKNHQAAFEVFALDEAGGSP